MKSSADLIRLVQDANVPLAEREATFATLVTRFYDTAFRQASTLLGDATLAEDAVQEAFLVVYRQIVQLHDPNAFPGWFRKIVRSQCHRLTRWKQHLTTSLDSIGDPPGRMAEPSEVVDQEELRRTVRLALGVLSERESTTLILFYLGDYSVAEMATFFGVPVTTVKKRLQYARQRLKDHGSELTSKSRHEFHPLNLSEYGSGVRLVSLGRAFAAESESVVSDLLKVDGVEGRTHDGDLQLLRFAVTQASYRALLEALVLDGVDLDDTDADGYTPFVWAVEYGDLETVDLLRTLRTGRRRKVASGSAGTE